MLNRGDYITNLILYQKTEDLIKYMHIKLMKFPKSEKYGLALEIRKCLYNMMGYCIEANNIFINTKYIEDIKKSIKQIDMADDTQYKEMKLFLLRTLNHYEISKNIFSKREVQNKIDAEIKKLKTFISLADELGYFGKRTYKDHPTGIYNNINEKISELGKILGGWIKSNK